MVHLIWDSNNVSICSHISRFWSNSINFSRNSQQIHNKLAQNLIKSCVTPYSKFIENHWKLIINSFKIN